MAIGNEIIISILGDASKFKSSLGEAENRLNKFAEKIGSIGKTMTIVGGAITAISIGLIKMASDAEETSSKFAVVFQDLSDEAEKTAKNLADNFGLSTKAAKQLLSDTGDLLSGFGFTGQAALDLSTKVNELAVDLASFTNFSGGAEGASRALTKALLGERESVKSLGISIMETDVQAKVLELTQKGLTFETDRQAKAYATLLIAQEQSKNAIGDFSRTSEGFANQMRILRAKLEDLVIALGEKLLPMATKIIGKIIKVVEKMNKWTEAHPKLVEWLVKTGATIGGLMLVGGPILMAISAFIRAKTTIDSVTFALKLLNIRMGVTGAMTTGTLIPSLAKLKLGLGTLGTIATGPIGIIAIAVGGLYLAWKKNLFGMRDITIEAFNDIRGNFTELKDSMAGGGGTVEAFAEDIDDLADSVDGLGEKTDDTKEALDEFVNKIETFDEWVERLAKENEEANKKMAKAAEDAYKKYTDAMKPVEDRLYELSHTEEEVAAKNLLTKKQQLEESVKAAGLSADKEKEELTKIREWYEKEIDLIKGKLEEQRDALIETANQSEESANKQKEAIREIKNEYDGLIAKIEGVGEAMAKAAKKAASEAFLAGVPTIEETGYIPPYVPELQLGTSRVPKTGIYKLDVGERVTPATQNTYDQRKREINININNPVVRNDNDITKIKQQVEVAFQEFTRQYGRSGFELAH